ncbi:MAG TPA: sterol desaturase family protein [Saprospiraceae bacterium]|nr:sterol desaturase family protein [Saprospiraceae bacterium]HMX89434.1 sterol desaturase family protein [Saprospiraceae bacterium]HMZ40051.1 sterol desaturase family protein [Saprospiraceae bacterium]HNA64471.1 sterol desaturase family protein [Saprospiraceae bacterium]HNB31237.1 sterol desaturase family protein [Saprospiraceae bacterium]
MEFLSRYLDIVINSYKSYTHYLIHEVLHPGWHNYFYWLLGLSLAVWMLEMAFPWRSRQGKLRKDFFLDAFYMFFNFFLLSLIGYSAISNVGVQLFNDFLGLFNIRNIVAIQIQQWPVVMQYLLLFVFADFIQWNIHRLLHRSPWLWEFHKLHHSVEEMGFAAHLRFHWMETIVYKSIQYIPLAMIGFGIQDFFIIHIIAVAIGHLNHANLGWDYGPLKYIVNNPVMHLWHHAKNQPKGSYGVNFGLSLSIWDYLFGTAYVPSKVDPYEVLGFEDIEYYPKDFVHQELHGLSSK